VAGNPWNAWPLSPWNARPETVEYARREPVERRDLVVERGHVLGEAGAQALQAGEAL